MQHFVFAVLILVTSLDRTKGLDQTSCRSPGENMAMPWFQLRTRRDNTGGAASSPNKIKRTDDEGRLRNSASQGRNKNIALVALQDT